MIIKSSSGPFKIVYIDDIDTSDVDVLSVSFCVKQQNSRSYNFLQIQIFEIILM